ncbi:MAG: pyridoxine 5'-phosphate synthase [Pseudomonadales bacterium]
MIRLSINLNKIALIRNSREGDYPNLLKHAQRCIEAGAQGITVHPRPDQRHIRAQDIRPLSKLCAEHPHVEFNIEGNPFAPAVKSGRPEIEDYPGFIALIEQAQPEQCTLVPDTDQQLTSDHGFDLRQDSEKLQPAIRACQSAGSRVSLFMDPDCEQIKRAAELGVECIELYTGPFAAEYSKDSDGSALYNRYCEAAECALREGLRVNAGHDLNLENLELFRQLPGLQEVSIGHAFTVDSLDMGLRHSVAAYLLALQSPEV